MNASDLLTMKQVCQLVGLSHSTIHRLRNEDDFPSPIKLGQAAVRFRRNEVEGWLENRPRVDERRRNSTQARA